VSHQPAAAETATDSALPPRRWAAARFEQGAAELAQQLLGASLVRVLEDGTRLAGRIVETEAYLGVKDRAAHSSGGRRTARNESMYAAAGTAYVYLIYGIHHCVNVVCGEREEPVAVLIRALEPSEAVATMFDQRSKARRETDLCSGPGKLCQALAINRDLDGEDLATSPRLFIEDSGEAPLEPARIVNAARIGVDYAGEWANKPLRWYLGDSAHVSVRSR